MEAMKTRPSSFSRNVPATSTTLIPGVKTGPNGTAFVSSGIPDLDSNFFSPPMLLLFDFFSVFFFWVAGGQILGLFLSPEILGGGLSLGSLVIVMEDPEAPHHMLLLRNFMSQGLVHNQSLVYASSAKDPKGFLGTLPSPVLSRTDKSPDHGSVEVLKSAIFFFS